MTEGKKYTGGCHCGRVRYEVTAELDGVISCNCSICSKKGTLLTFVPADRFKLLAGEGLTDYQFHRNVIHHLFCSTCGVESFATGKGVDGGTMYAVNVRCLDDVELSSLKVRHFDGRSL